VSRTVGFTSIWMLVGLGLFTNRSNVSYSFDGALPKAAALPKKPHFAWYEGSCLETLPLERHEGRIDLLP
jgi:hypothetical protein